MFDKSELKNFLINKGCQDTKMASLLFWYLLVEWDNTGTSKKENKVKEFYNEVY